MRVKLTIFVVWIMWINYPQTADAIPVSILPFVSHNLNSIAMENQKEIWKDVKGYEGLYQVSSFGRVKSFHKKSSGNILKPQKRSLYFKVSLCKDGNQRGESIHVLVAIAFLNHTPNGLKIVVNHKDYNKYNNRLNNLEIVTSRTNGNKKHIKHTSDYTGVCQCKNSKKWISSIYGNGKTNYLGLFNTEEEAYNCYNDALLAINNGQKIERKIRQKSSKYKGISFCKKTNKWYSFIVISGKTKNLGYFNTEFEAHTVFENKLKELK